MGGCPQRVLGLREMKVDSFGGIETIALAREAWHLGKCRPYLPPGNSEGPGGIWSDYSYRLPKDTYVRIGTRGYLRWTED